MKRTPLRRVSRKREAALEQRADVREFVLDRDGHACQFWTFMWDATCPEPLDFGNNCPQFCNGGEPDVHEVTPRGTHPGSELNPGVCVALCRTHHQFIHSRPKLGYQTGLLKRWSAS